MPAKSKTVKGRDWAEQRAADLVRDYGTFPQLGETPRTSEPRTIRVIAAALREAHERGRKATPKL